MRHLGVVAVRLVQCIGLPNTRVDREWIALIALLRIVGFSVDTHEVGEKRIWAGSVPRRVRHPDDVFIGPLWESGCLAELRVGELLAQLLGKVGASLAFAVKLHAEAFDLALFQSFLLDGL